MFFLHLAGPTSLQRTKQFFVGYIRLPLVVARPRTNSGNFNSWWKSYVEPNAQLIGYRDIYELS